MGDKKEKYCKIIFFGNYCTMPCYFVSLVGGIIIAAPAIGIGSLFLSQYVALLLSITILITYFVSKYIAKYIKKPYSILIGNFMLFLGLYFLISGLILPNINILMENNFESISLFNTSSLTILLIIFIIFVIIGIITTKNNNLKQ